MARTRTGNVKEGTGRVAPAVSPMPAASVQGVKLRVTGRELAVRIGERIRWHRQRSDALLAQMKRFAEAERDAGSDLHDMLGRYESPRIQLEKKLREHRERASFLAFVRDHVSEAETYQLDSTDLRMTEILPDKPW